MSLWTRDRIAAKSNVKALSFKDKGDTTLSCKDAINNLIDNHVDDFYNDGYRYDDFWNFIHDVATEAYQLGYSDGKSKIDSKPTIKPNRYECDKKLFEKGIAASIKSLKNKGYEIISHDYSEFNVIDIVARNTEDGTIHFIAVDVQHTSVNEDFTVDRLEAEADAVHFMNLYPDIFSGVGDVSFDTITITMTGYDKALLCHHIGIFSE